MIHTPPTPNPAAAVPMHEATAHDFIQIRAALVRRLGSANAALVWSRVYYRANPGNPNAYERDGFMWWRATREIVADETGLNPGQARRTLEALVEQGSLIAEKHRLAGNYDQAKSYRCNVVADTANDWAPATNEHRSSATDLDWAPATNLPVKTPQDGLTPSSSSHVTTASGSRDGLDDEGSYSQGGDAAVDSGAVVRAVLQRCGREISNVEAYGIIGIVLDRTGGKTIASPTAYVVAAIESDPFGWQSYIDTRKVPA
jgi:hypothetical protein